jgi:predicted metal-dependent RNase
VPRGAARYTIGRPIPRTTSSCDSAVIERTRRRRLRARIYTINGFSAHADQAELLAWQKQTSAKRTFLVHGEEDIMRQFAANFVDTRVEMPGPNQVFEL